MKLFRKIRLRSRPRWLPYAVALSLSALSAGPACAGSSSLVISQVYGGGGNSGAPYKSYFIELFNNGTAPVSLNGMSVQYASATGTSWTNLTSLPNVTLQPGQYFLVQEYSGSTGSALPAADATGIINLSATAGKVALVNGTSALTCGSSCANDGSVVDFVGFGTTANSYEGSGPAPAPSNTTSVIRSNPCTDNNDNKSEFAAVAPNPRNTSSAMTYCLPPVNGACGSDNNATLAATAPTNLCSAGTASQVTGGGHPWNWSCIGLYGGSTATCQASIQSYALTFSTDGNGTLSGATIQSVDFGASSSPVVAAGNSGFSFLNWTGTNGFTSTNVNPLTVSYVSASQTVTANFASKVNGACGSDDGKTLAATAPTGLCSAGTASSVSGNGHPWSWSCAGADGGGTASCSASIKSYTVTFNAGDNGTLNDGATKTMTQTVDFNGATVPVTAVPAGSAVFANWSDVFGSDTTNPFVLANVRSDQAVTANFSGIITILHVNDTHARVTPHKWVVTEHGTDAPKFEDVGGAAYLASEMLQLTAANPSSLVVDAGDISEGNPIGDMNGNGAMTQFYTLLSAKLKAQRGRGLDAVVVGNHDVRDANYINNMVALRNSGVPLISVNVRDINTHLPFFAPYTIVNVNGKKVGILGYTTSASEVGASLASTLEVVDCDWNSADTTKVHLADYVNELRNNQGCDLVVLLAHIGHSALVDPSAPLLADDGSAKLPEAAVTGHWHTWAETAWQPAILNYKTVFTESSSYMKYIGELKLDDSGKYLSSVQHVIRDADLTPDPDVQSLINGLTAQYNAAHPGHPVDEVIGYTADDLLLDNEMKWWSANEYPWSGNNSAGQWICDAMRWKAEQIFGQCDLAMEAGGGVRADIPAGPVTYLQIYETFPWNDDTFTRVNMTGQEIVNFLKATTMDAGFSSALDVTAFDGVPTSVKFNGQPIDLARTYTAAINNYMYNHPPKGFTWSDSNPSNSAVLCRDGLVDYMRNFGSGNPYRVGGDRYHLNTEFSGGYRAVVTMMNDNDTKDNFEYAFVRLLSATPETLARRGSHQVPGDLVNADGTVNAVNRLSEQELYRSYLGFKSGALKPGDVIEIWGKGAFYGGNPEFVDQEGVYGDGVEFKVVGHDDSLAKPTFFSSIASFWNDTNKNHYVQFLAKKSGASSVTDQNGQTLSLMDVTGYVAKTLPGNNGDPLLISGVPTMESYGLRFRCASATATPALLPAPASVSSHLDPIAPATTGSPLALSASALVNSGTFYLTPVADAQVASGKPTTTTNNNNLYLQSSSVNSYGNERAWLKFDLSGLPAGATITGANLQLWDWKATGAAMPAEVRGGSDDSWSETGINWNNQPALGDTALDTQTLAAATANLWYNWNVTPFVQQKWSGNKLVSLVLKPANEGSSDATAPSYAFDSREYGSNAPLLKVTTSSGGSSVAGVRFFYRYSSDNASWGSWTPVANVTTPPYTAGFGYPQGAGYYEFYSQATDTGNNVEPAPAAAQAATHYTSSPAYYPITSLDGLYQRYDGNPKQVNATTLPAGTPVTVTYNGSTTAPTAAGTYAVSVIPQGSTVASTGMLSIVKAQASASFDNLNFVYDGKAKTATLSTTPAGLNAVVTYNGSTTQPISAGTYALVSVINSPNYQGGATGTLTIAPDPASAFSVITSGFVNNRITKTYHGTMTIKNISQATVSSPSGIQLNNLTAGVTLASMVVPPAQPLAPGMSISVSLDFSNPLNKSITFTPVLLP